MAPDRAIREYLEFPLACPIAEKEIEKNEVVHIESLENELEFCFSRLGPGGHNFVRRAR